MIDRSLTTGRHRAVTDAIRWLEVDEHLPAHLRPVAQIFEDAAADVLHFVKTDDPQITHMINHLTKAKDAAVRAKIVDGEATST
jgi:hypothetical protein